MPHLLQTIEIVTEVKYDRRGLSLLSVLWVSGLQQHWAGGGASIPDTPAACQ